MTRVLRPWLRLLRWVGRGGLSGIVFIESLHGQGEEPVYESGGVGPD